MPVKHFSTVKTRSALLSSELVSALAEVGVKLQANDDASSSVSAALALLAGLQPGHVARADGEIAIAADLHRKARQSPLSRVFAPRPDAAIQLLQTPRLEYLFLFHRDGRLREAALHKITVGLPSPFLFAAVLWRLNDWAEPVRRAAARCASRSFPLTAPAVVARTVAELLVRQASWRRWQEERSILDKLFGRSDVAAELASLMSAAATGPQASMLRHALRSPGLDPHLEALAFEATQPSVRAVALGALIAAKAEWPSGTAWRWIDKSMGLRRRETVFDDRALTVTLPRSSLIEHGLKDRSALVRKVALTGVIRHMLGTAEASGLAAPLLLDRSSSVREKATFILRDELS